MGSLIFIVLLVIGVYQGMKKGNVLTKAGNVSDDMNIKSATLEASKYIGVGIILLLLLNGITLVGAGEAGIVFNRFTGMTDKNLQEGFNWVNPITDKVKVYDIKVTKGEYAKISGLSSDSQTIVLDLVVNYKLDSTKLQEIYQKVQGDIRDTILLNAILDTSKAELGKFRIGDIAQNREKLKAAIEDTLTIRMKKKYVDIINISVTNVDYSDAYEKAIEAKLVAEQAAMEAKNKKEETRYAAEAKAIENRNLARTITPLVLQQKWIEAWDKGGAQVPQVVVSGGKSTPFMLNLNDLKKGGK